MALEAATAREWIKRSADALADWRDETGENYEFVDGQQISDDDMAELERKRRPQAIFNRIHSIVNAVVGAEVANRMEPVIRPMEVGDSGTAEVLTSAVIWARDQSQADAEQTDAFRDLVICGMGWTETRPDYDGDRPEVVEERASPLDMVWDHRASKANIRDRRWTARALPMAIDEAMELWPDAEASEMDAKWWRAGLRDGSKTRSGMPGEAYNAGYKSPGEPDTRVVTVVQMEWWEREQTYLVVVEGAEPAEVIGVRERKDIENGLIQRGIPYRIERGGKRKVYWRGVLGATGWLERNRMDPQRGGFRFKAMTGYRQRLRNGGCSWYGLTRMGMDPQRWANKFYNEILYLISISPLGGVLAEEDALVDPAKAEQQLRTPGAVVMTHPGGLNRIRELPSANVPQAIGAMMEHALKSIRDCMGVSEEMMGQAMRIQAGVVERQRRQSSMNVLSTLFDSLTQFREDQARLMVHMVLTHMADGRIIRIAGKQQAEYAHLMPPESEIEYDIKVTESPTSVDSKQEAWEFIEKMMPHLMQAQLSPAIWAAIIRYSPLPSSLADMIAKEMEQPPQRDPEAEERKKLAIQIAIQQALADVAETQARAAAQEASADEKRSASAENIASAVLDLAKAKGEGQGITLQAARDALATAKAMGEASRARDAALNPPQPAGRPAQGNGQRGAAPPSTGEGRQQ